MFSFGRGRYVVCARAGDPLARSARARLIWAANTASATGSLGVPATLVASSSELPFKVANNDGLDACRRLIDSYYNVDTNFDIQLTYAPSKRRIEKERLDPLAWQIENDFQFQVLPRSAVVHSRDPQINRLCHWNKVPFIYEDHSEDFHTAVQNASDARLDSEYCRAIVAIAPDVRVRLIGMGVPTDKIIVVESGLNERGIDNKTEPYSRWRHFLLGGSFKQLVVYTGGMQAERDIEAALMAAKGLPHVKFAFAGGHSKDVGHWKSFCESNDIENAQFLGYLPHAESSALQHAADVLLYSRKAGPRGQITSPLKLYEYLAAGKKVVAALLPQLLDVGRKGIPITWYNPELDELTAKLADALRAPDLTAQQVDIARQFARQFSWANRQRRILEFAGLRTPAQLTNMEGAHV